MAIEDIDQIAIRKCKHDIMGFLNTTRMGAALYELEILIVAGFHNEDEAGQHGMKFGILVPEAEAAGHSHCLTDAFLWQLNLDYLLEVVTKRLEEERPNTPEST